MPFVIRKIEPRYLCRSHVPTGPAPQDWPVGAELFAVANGALANSLKQLASVLSKAEDIFAELTVELTNVAERSGRLRCRLDKVEQHLATIDPKKIPVPESDICTFALRKVHFNATNGPTKALFTLDTRPKALKELYDAAAIVAVRSLDSLRRDGSSMDMFLCTPVLGKRIKRDQSLDIESRVPAAIEDLRRWTSAEALGDVTVAPDCMSRILCDTTDDNAVDHKLPSPEEQVQAVALKFPAEIVAVDVSGRGFARMSFRRKSLLSSQENQELSVRRRSRPRRPRGKRRNTLAGTDQKEIRQAVGEEETGVENTEDDLTNVKVRAHRSASTDILGSSKKDSPMEKKSHFNTLKSWGMSRLKLISPKSQSQLQQQQQRSSSQEVINAIHTPTTANVRGSESKSQTIEDINIYETVTTRRRKDKPSYHERKPSSSSSSGKSTSSIPLTIPNSVERQNNVKLRDSAAERRERRKGSNNREDAPHSSSGNWSASSESGRASIGSETTTTTHQPRSITTTSIGTSSTSLSHVRRLKGRDTSASSSVTSEGTLTPDIIQDITTVPFSDDGETSSVYSCDTEGYYTSFHMDSGLKTLREEDSVPQSPLVKSNELSGTDSTSPMVENEYELFGRGSTSTTTSSAGTVCTALLAPQPPERKSSLTVVAMVHGQKENGGESPDSGHNTSSSPVESASSPVCTGRSCSEFEYSESSDLEGCDRIERIRSKTAINTSRIPSMCVITPPGSDDEQHNNNNNNNKDTKKENNRNSIGSVLMSATVGTSKMEVINGQDKNLYATVQVLPTSERLTSKISQLSGVLGKIRGVLPGKKHNNPKNPVQEGGANVDSGDYVTIADVRNNNDKRSGSVTYANADIFGRDAEYISLSELPKKQDSSLERRRQGARVVLDAEGKVVYSSDSLKRRKGAHTTFNPGPFIREGTSPNPSPLLHRATSNIRAVVRSKDTIDGTNKTTPPTSPQLGKVIIRAAKSPDRAASPDYVRTPSTVVGPTSPTSPHKQVRGAYVNVQGEEENTALPIVPQETIQPLCKENCHNEETPIINSTDHKWQKPYQNDPYLSRVNRTICEIQRENAKNQQYHPQSSIQQTQQFYTLPTRRPQREIEPPRSVTPDITRGLRRDLVNSKHDNRLHAKSIQNSDTIINNKLGNDRTRVDVKNRFAVPMSLNALGYRFFASSPVNTARSNSPNSSILKHNAISPIGHGYGHELKSSTGRLTPTVAERLALNVTDNNIDKHYPRPNGLDSPTSSGRSTPNNLILSPSKSTMSNEELFAAIHKSKKKLNIKDESENLSPNSSMNSLVNIPPRSRYSYTLDLRSSPEIPTRSPSATARLDFKRLLLQQSVKTGPTRPSAAEQLKLSRQQCQQQQQNIIPVQSSSPSSPLSKISSPRNNWRFQTPRTDVLSSTIIEDTAAEERAMKPSPENISPISRLNTKGLNRDKVLETRPIATKNCTPASAFESRRMSNQLARAQFLSATTQPNNPQNQSAYLRKRFRARSESPQQSIAQNVPRSPSAPALETAL